MRKAASSKRTKKIKVAHVHAPRVSLRSQGPSTKIVARVQPVRLRKPLIINREN